MRKRLLISVVAAFFFIAFSITMFGCAKKTVNCGTADQQAAVSKPAAKPAESTIDQQNEEQKRLIAEKNKFINVNILFDYDSAELTSTAQGILKEKAAWLKANNNAKTLIAGHCDERGTIEYNIALGERRAAAVKNFLVNLGIAEARMRTISYGEEKPVALGRNEEAWRLNRRAQFSIE